jgi:galactonate dehydratase
MKNNRRDFLAKSLSSAATVGLAISPMNGFTKSFGNAMIRNEQYSLPSDIKITGIKCGFIRGGHDLFVKILTNQEVWGCGEGADATPGSYYLVKMMGERLKGKSPLNVHRLFEDLRKSGFFEGAQSGMYIAVLSAVEAALWDLAGKILGLPIYQLLGGKFRDKVRVYLDTALYQSQNPKPEEFAQAAKNAVSMGFNAIKFDVDQANDPNKYDHYNWTASPAELRRMFDQISAARQAVGPNIDICVDMHGKYDVTTGERVAKLFEPLNLMWLEEPVPAENADAYKKIADSTSTPICGGENFYLAHGFREYLEKNAVDIIMPDLQKCGGLGEGQRIANLANLYYVPFAPHMVSSYLAAMASAHVCASVPNFLILEWQIYFHTDQMFKDIIKYDGEWVNKSFITVSDKPGVGVEINEEGMKKYATPGVPFFE